MNDFLPNQKNKSSEEQMIVKVLLEKETKLKNLRAETKKLKKEQDQIQKSKVWKVTKPLRKFTNAFTKSKEQERFGHVQAELQRVKEEANRLKEQNQLLQYELDRVNEANLFKQVKEAKVQGSIINKIEQLTISKLAHQTKYKNALQYAARLYQLEDTRYKTLVYNSVLKGLLLEETPEFIIRATESNNEISLREASSFKANLAARARRRQMHAMLPEWILDNKLIAYQFIDTLEVKRPFVSDEVYSIETLPEKENVVIKPAHGAGSRGVYLLFNSANILNVKTSSHLHSWTELTESMKQDLASHAVEKDKWIIEELLVEDEENAVPARDYKFYCFYGKVGLILEVQRFPEVTYCWWTADGKRISTGKYEHDLYKGEPVTQADIELVSKISSEIPTPFIRIDFLNTKDGLVFGEFTPKPGNYDEIDAKTDEWLGEYFLDAENRLLHDLLHGKEFRQFKNLKM